VTPARPPAAKTAASKPAARSSSGRATTKNVPSKAVSKGASSKATARSGATAKPVAKTATKTVGKASKVPPKAVKAVKTVKTAKAVKAARAPTGEKVVKKSVQKPAARAVAPKKATEDAAPTTAKSAAPLKALGAAKVARVAKPATTKTAAPRAKGSVGPYASEPKFLEEQRKLLFEERATYQGQMNDLRAEAESLALEREPGDVQFDEESGEGGTVAVDRERDLTLAAQAQQTIAQIDIAIAAVDDKSYGSCDNCHQPIPKARLRALPYVRLCVACKSGGLHRR
jgi:DnaK suppressor protein